MIDSGTEEPLVQELFSIYNEAERRMLEKVAKRTKRGVTQTGWAETKLTDVQNLKQELEQYIKTVNTASKKKVSKGISSAYNKGVMSANRDHGIVDETLNSKIPPHIQDLVLKTNNLIDNTSFRILRSSEDVYRQVIADTSTSVLVGTDTPQEAAQSALNRFAAKGVTGFVDKLGRNWELASYVEMATRTTTSQAALQGHIDRQVELGNDLVQVSAIGTTCPLCAPWQGKVLSISGKDKNYPSLGMAKQAGLFHPNCKHTITAYFEGVDDYETPVVNNNPERYQATQVQRHHERQIRKWKRVEAVALSEADRIQAARKVQYWQKRQREHIDNWNLRRNYAREKIKTVQS